MLPFTREQFFQVFAAYNAANWPIAMLAYPLAVFALFVAGRRTSTAGRAVGIILALMWAWVGVVYQGVYFSQVNPIARAFAGASCCRDSCSRLTLLLDMAWSSDPVSRVRAFVGGSMIAYAMPLYPLIGLAVGERYPGMPLFGVAPCPLLIFTFGLMLWASCARWWLWIVPLLWSAIGGSAFIVLSVPQDWALPISAIAAVAVILLERRSQAAPQAS